MTTSAYALVLAGPVGVVADRRRRWEVVAVVATVAVLRARTRRAP